MAEYDSIGSLPTIPSGQRYADSGFNTGDLVMNRYEVLAELGRGGMGVVYECYDRIAGIKVALKALPPELSHNTDEMDDVRENFQLVSKLVHQNIAISKNLERDEWTGDYYLIMERCEGENLRHWIKRKRREGKLLTEEIVPVIKQVAAALDYAHGKKVMHRDIKPGNIMIDCNGDVKVLDFGLAAQIRTSLSRVSMAYRGTSGTGPYMSPEQWLGRPQGAAADQYALAVMAYEMLAGYLPFDSSDIAILKQAILDNQPEKIDGVPPHIQSAIFKALSKSPADRFASCTAFVEAMENKAAPIPEPVSEPEPEQPEKPESAKPQGSGFSKNWLIAFLVLIIIGGAFYIANQKPPVVPPPIPTGQTSGQTGQTTPTGQTTLPETESRFPNAATETLSLPGGVELKLIRIPKGGFQMGSPDGSQGTAESGRDSDEGQHGVTLSHDFYLGETEVTQGQWKAIMRGKLAKQDKKDLTNPSYFRSDDRPVEQVSWNDAMQFCEELNKRFSQQLNGKWKFTLPTEAQWEYACRGGTTTSLNNGENMIIRGTNNSPNLDGLGWYGGNCGQNFELSNGYDISGWSEKQYSDSRGGTHPVRRKRKNDFGLYDMHGNVWEWCLDWYKAYPNYAVKDPTGPDTGSYRVRRGGSWFYDPRYCRSAERSDSAPTYRSYDVGFRVALVPVD